MQSSPPAETGIVVPRVSRLAVCALALVVVCAIAILVVGGGSAQLAPALVGLAGLILAHVAYFRIRKSDGALTGIGFSVAALVVGYGVLVVGAVGLTLYVFVMSHMSG